MKIVRFSTQSDTVHYGILNGDQVTAVKGDIFGDFKETGTTYDIEDINILSPCVPSKIVAIGLNYRDHAVEMDKELPVEPRMFLKPSTAVIGHGNNIMYPGHMSSHVDYEGELAVVIRKVARHVSEADAFDYILGYTCANDITARDLQARDIQFTRAKGFDTFAPLGPVIETDLDPGKLDIATYLNGERKQHSNTANLIFGVPHLVHFISSVMTLIPGDIISTGTPSGVGPMHKGDIVEVEIEGIGKLCNQIA